MGAFYCCKNLKSIDIPAGVTTIAYNMFCRCDRLQSVSFGGVITSVEENAFYGCKNLQEVKFGGSLTSIEEYAFQGCENLQSVIIPESVTNIGKNAFTHCENLRNVWIESAFVYGEGVFEERAIITAPKYSPDGILSPALKRSCTLGYLKNGALFTDPDAEARYRQYAIGPRKKLLPEIFKSDSVEMLTF